MSHLAEADVAIACVSLRGLAVASGSASEVLDWCSRVEALFSVREEEVRVHPTGGPMAIVSGATLDVVRSTFAVVAEVESARKGSKHHGLLSVGIAQGSAAVLTDGRIIGTVVARADALRHIADLRGEIIVDREVALGVLPTGIGASQVRAPWATAMEVRVYRLASFGP